MFHIRAPSEGVGQGRPVSHGQQAAWHSSESSPEYVRGAGRGHVMPCHQGDGLETPDSEEVVSLHIVVFVVVALHLICQLSFGGYDAPFYPFINVTHLQDALSSNAPLGKKWQVSSCSPTTMEAQKCTC